MTENMQKFLELVSKNDELTAKASACVIFKSGWAEKIRETLRQIDPALQCRV